MYCRKCGNELQDDWKVCPNCGEPVNDVGQNLESFANETEGPEPPKKDKILPKMAILDNYSSYLCNCCILTAKYDGTE